MSILIKQANNVYKEAVVDDVTKKLVVTEEIVDPKVEPIVREDDPKK